MDKCEIVDFLSQSSDYSFDQLNVSSIFGRQSQYLQPIGSTEPLGSTAVTMASPKASATTVSANVTMEDMRALLAENNATILADMKKAYTAELNKALAPVK